MGSFFYDDYYDYGDLDLGVGGLFDGLLGGFGSLFDGLFSYDYHDDYDYFGHYDYYGYGDDDDTSLTVDGSDADVNGLLSSILGMLGDGETNLTVDGSDADLNGLLSSILGMLGDGDTTLTVDGSDADLNGLLSSILGLFGDSETALTVDGESADIGGFLSSILGMFGGDGETALSVDGESADVSGFLTSFLGLLGDSETALTVDGESADIGGFLSSILGMFGGDGSGLSLTVDSELGDTGNFLTSFLTLFGGNDTTLSVDGESADLSGVLSSILGGTSGLDLTSILGGTSGLDLTSILGLLGGGSDTTLSVGSENTSGTGIDLSSLLSILGGSGTSLSVEGSTAGTGIDLSSILALLGGNGTSLSVSGSTATNALGALGNLGNIGNLFSGLAALYNGITNMNNTTGDASWEDLAFLDDLEKILPNANNGTSSDLTSILGSLGGSGSGLDLASILALLGGSGTGTAISGTTAGSGLDLASILALLSGSGTTITVDNTSTSTTPTASATPSTTDSTQAAELKALLDALADNNAKLKLDITLSTDDGSTASFQFDGLLSTFLNNMPATLTIDKSFDDLIATYYSTPVSVVPTEDFDEVAKSLPTTVRWESNQDTAADNPRSAILERSQPSGYWVEIASDAAFDGAVRILTTDTAFDVDGSAGAYAVRASAKGGDFSDASAEWTSETNEPRRIVSNGNGLADIFFASAAEGDVWTANYFAQNAITGEIADIAGRNRIRDTFTGSESDANILYLTDSANGDALFMDDVYSEFGDAARLSLIREVRAGAGDDVVDMTAEHFAAQLAGMTVRGGSGDDVLWGADGGNRLFGDDGADKIVGGSGDDVIAGGDGNDTLNGGGGNDVFTFGNDWGADVVTQLAGGKVTLWFADAESMIRVAELAGNTLFTNATGSSVVMVQNLPLSDITVKYGDDGSDEFAALSAAGAFLGSTADSVFETQDMRSQGILASL
ncbi:MAG: hypothetical protein PUC15_03640 [Lentisphaeria bacterium]|nr:hypothetical protein [Lentisphaeria bacterium]